VLQTAYQLFCSSLIEIPQLAALQLIERGKISPEDPVVDYLPQMANPVIIEDVMADNLVYKPAQNVIRLKHLLNFTNGTFYPVKGSTNDSLLPEAYAVLHPKDDHITGFFDVVKVCEFLHCDFHDCCITHIGNSTWCTS